MQENRMESVCALLCLLSSLNRCPDDPAPLSRSAVRRLLACGAIDGLVLRDDEALPPETLMRARALLSRASGVYASLERYMESGYQVLLPQDAAWPEKLHKLGANMPLYLFARGNTALLSGRAIAVAGSRAIRRGTKGIAERIGALLAGKGIAVVSGGAQGVDSAAQRAALEAGGGLIVVPALPVKEILREPVYQNALDAGRLLILCETPPDEGFSAQKALTRNHTIYALGSCALVVASREGKGGSWSGAKACIAGGWSPVYALDEEGGDFAGNAALLAQGALRMKLIREETGDDLLFEGPSGISLEQTRMDLEGAHANTGQA